MTILDQNPFRFQRLPGCPLQQPQAAHLVTCYTGDYKGHLLIQLGQTKKGRNQSLKYKEHAMSIL